MKKNRILYYQSPYPYQECMERLQEFDREVTYRHELLPAEEGGWILRVWRLETFAPNRSIEYWMELNQFIGYTLIQVECQNSPWYFMTTGNRSYYWTFWWKKDSDIWSMDAFLKKKLDVKPMISK